MRLDPRRAVRLAVGAALAAALPAAGVEVSVPVQIPEMNLGAAPGAFSGALQAGLPQASIPIGSPSLTAVPVASSLLDPAPSVTLPVSAVPANKSAAPAAPAASGDSTGADPGRGTFDGADILAGERPAFTPEDIARVQGIDRALTAAVREAATSVLKASPANVVSRGSTSRLTHTETNPDYDVNVNLPETPSAAEFDELVSRRYVQFQDALSRAISRSPSLSSRGRLSVSIQGPRTISDPVSLNVIKGVVLLRVRADGPRESLDLDVSLTNLPSYANPYPAYFQDQLGQVAARDGEDAARKVIDDIRLAKVFFHKLHAYKFYEGGPSGVGAEQLVMQSGKVLDSDRGRTVLETGSFDRMMGRLYDAAYDQNGNKRSFDEARRTWTVHNAFMAPGNFLDLMEMKWEKVARVVKNYRAAKAEGRPISFDEIIKKTPPVRTPRPPSVAPAVLPPLLRFGFALVDQNGRMEPKARGELKRLLAETSDVNAADPRNGATALHQAVIGGNLDAVEMLLAHPRIDAGRKNMNGKAAADMVPAMAKKARWLKIRALLRAR